MILSRPDILQYLKEGSLRIEPHPSEEQIDQVSIDLHLDRHFFTFKEKLPKYLPHVRVDSAIGQSKDLVDRVESDTFLLKPKQLVLAQTREWVHLPRSLMGFIEGRSTFARFGLTAHLAAPKIDPGFKGHITLEIVNLGTLDVMLHAYEDKPAQLILAKLLTDVSSSEEYGASSDHVYQDQTKPLPEISLTEQSARDT